MNTWQFSVLWHIHESWEPDIMLSEYHVTVYFIGYSEAHVQFLLKKFLLLVFFLDHAKLTRLIDFDPCLFQVTSVIKVHIKY